MPIAQFNSLAMVTPGSVRGTAPERLEKRPLFYYNYDDYDVDDDDDDDDDCYYY